MARGVVNHFNRGEVDQRALAREDLKRVNNSASLMRNFIPTRLGPMMYRPGMEYIGELNGSYDHRQVEFIKAVDDVANLDFYNETLEFIVNDTIIKSTAVTSAFVNGDFTADIASWTDASGGTATTAWYDYGGGDGALALTGDGSDNAVSYQTIGATDTGSEHFMRVVIDRAPVEVQIGTSGVGTYDIFRGTLKPGEHVLTFSPGANITITFKNSKKYRALINSISFDGAANLSIGTPLMSASLQSLRTVQSGDVVFCAHDGGKQFQVEHRGDKSWSVIDYRSDDGPFDIINTTNVTLNPGALSGDTTLTASEDFFDADHVGTLFKAASVGQQVAASVSVDTGAGTSSILVTGVGGTRAFTVSASGMTTSTVTLQRSADDSSWDDVETYTTTTSKAYNDGFDNSIFFYRLFVKAGDNPLPDTIALNLNYATGSIEGIARVTKYTSATAVEIQILQDFGDTNATLDWYQGSWSAASQYPVAVELTEGRLWFSGAEEIWGSVSDAYFSFDRSIEGDSASILRTIGFGPSDPVKWMKAAGQLIVGTTGDEIVVRSSSFGEPLTPSTANVKSGSDQGSGNVEPVKVDGTIYFVQRSGVKIYSLQNLAERDAFSTLDATILNQSIVASGVIRLARARQPETRIFAVLSDGDVAVYTVDAAEEVSGWSRLVIDGGVKDVIVLPETDEDRVYFVVERTGGTYLEKLAKFKDSEGGNISETFDSFKRYTSPGTVIAGLSHLENEDVGVWADGQDRGAFTVYDGQITVGSSWANVIVGLPYVADYISNKLSGYQQTTGMTEKKRIIDTGLVMMNYVPESLSVGPTEALLKKLPLIEEGTTVDPTVTITDYSEVPFEFDGETEADPRIYMRATGPCMIMALTYDAEDEAGNKASEQG